MFTRYRGNKICLDEQMNGHCGGCTVRKHNAFTKTVWSMPECIRGSYDDALYKPTYNLLYFTLPYLRVEELNVLLSVEAVS